MSDKLHFHNIKFLIVGSLSKKTDHLHTIYIHVTISFRLEQKYSAWLHTYTYQIKNREPKLHKKEISYYWVFILNIWRRTNFHQMCINVKLVYKAVNMATGSLACRESTVILSNMYMYIDIMQICLCTYMSIIYNIFIFIGKLLFFFFFFGGGGKMWLTTG